ncbi:transporter [uncultured Chryseobacterium sp.]|uniref:transporter n=1 Tax=uncultured Chryseobacterium sp. TaxID=259322 RepID=UPI0025FB20AE|nr:transporter [uncultured Chryseobacterium sp.]
MNKNHHIFLLLCGLLLAPVYHKGQENAEKKYSIFHPVPASLMRDMETDRPDVTESAYTVDAGHFQYETDLVRLIKEKSDSREVSTVLVNHGNIKLGITGSTAIQIGFETYGVQQEKDLSSGVRQRTEGFGDINFRIKQNLIGNDHGNFVLAVLPYIKFPTSGYDEESRFEGGLIVPMLYKLPGQWKLGFQVEVDRLKDLDEPAMHTELLQTLTISHSIIKSIDAIAETYYTYDFKAHQLSNYINAALEIDVAKDFKVDAGFNYGIQHQAQKHYFVGASYRH